MRHTPDIRDREILEDLRRAEADLLRTPCAFWACRGPEDFEDMVTCTKCHAIIMLREARRKIERIENLTVCIRRVRPGAGKILLGMDVLSARRGPRRMTLSVPVEPAGEMPAAFEAAWERLSSAVRAALQAA